MQQQKNNLDNRRENEKKTFRKDKYRKITLKIEMIY